MVLERMIFFPSRDAGPPPSGVMEQWLRSADGVRLHAWYAEAGKDSPTLVWSHGNGGNIRDRADVLLMLRQRGLNVLAYDYRGYGQSQGRPDEDGVIRDAQAAYDHLRDAGVAAENLVCLGESLGGAVSLALAASRPCAAVVVVATFTTLKDVARHHYGVLGSVVGGRFDSLSRVAALRVPLLVAHGDQDEVVPFALGQRLYQAASMPKQFLRVPGASHNTVFTPVLVDAIARFVQEVLGTRR